MSSRSPSESSDSSSDDEEYQRKRPRGAVEHAAAAGLGKAEEPSRKIQLPAAATPVKGVKFEEKEKEVSLSLSGSVSPTSASMTPPHLSTEKTVSYLTEHSSMELSDDSSSSRHTMTVSEVQNELVHIFKIRRLQKKERAPIKPYEPKYIKEKEKLEKKVMDVARGRRVELVGDEVWEQGQRWHQDKPTKRQLLKGVVPSGRWKLSQAGAGSVIQKYSTYNIERVKSPVDRRRVESASKRRKRNVVVSQELTGEVQQVPFRQLVFYESPCKAKERTIEEEKSIRRRARTKWASYYPTPLEGVEPHYVVPKSLLSAEERAALRTASTQSGRSSLPSRGGTPSLMQSRRTPTQQHRPPTGMSGTSSTMAPHGPQGTIGGLFGTPSPSRPISTPMKFALPPLHDVTHHPTPAMYCPTNLRQRMPTDKKCPTDCHHCKDVAGETDHFDALEWEKAKKEQEALQKLQESLEAQHKAQQDRDTLGSEAGQASPLLPRKGPPKPAPMDEDGLPLEPVIESRNRISESTARMVVKAVEKLKLGAQRRFHRNQRKNVRDDRGVTIAHLYQGMTHRDREDVYISVTGGLSFDLTREKFSLLVLHVLAPRIGVTVADDQVHQMFNVFDINHGGTISYFEYLAALCHSLLTDDQTAFVTGIFQMLVQQRLQAAQQREMTKKPLSQLAPSPTPPQSGVPASVTPESRGSLPGQADREGQQQQPPIPEGSRLKKRHLTYEKLRQVVFNYRGHSLMFPHPIEDRFCHAMEECFDDLRDQDEVDIHKFRLLCFCDESVIEALGEMYPGHDFGGSGEESTSDEGDLVASESALLDGEDEE